MTLGVAANSYFARSERGGDLSTHPAVSLWLFLVAALVVVMVAVGGATRLTDSGLSITEWKPLLGAIPPLSAEDWAVAFEKYRQIPEYQLINKGMSLAEFQFIYWWEWAHRFLGRAIGLVYAVPLAIFWWMGAIPHRFKLPLVGVLLLGALQGFVGWYMVSSGLTERVDVSQYRLAMHLALAFVILAALVWLALATRARDPLLNALPASAAARWFARAVLLGVLAQVVLGAFVAGTKAGLTYNTWPLMDGDWIPPGMWSATPWYINATENLTTIQFNHRLAAYILVALAVVQAALIPRWLTYPHARVSAVLLAIAMIAQMALGIWTLLVVDGAIPIGLGVSHQTFAAILLALAVWHLFNTTRPRGHPL